MTPFDPAALLAILVTFYQPATPANLARAFAERPEYFAGGSLIGHSGDALQLPDGVVWDLIFSVDDPDRAHYQTIIPSGGADDRPDPLFTLTPGGLTPAPRDGPRIHPAGSVFEPLVASALGDLNDADLAIAARAADLAGATSITDAMQGAGSDIDDAAGALNEEIGGIAAAAPGDVLDNTDQHGATIPAREAVYDDPAPGYADPDPRPAPPPDSGPDVQTGGGGDTNA